jgi:superoxide reductase
MATKDSVYECEVCGNVVETLRGGVAPLICCGKPMVERIPQTEDKGNEKHKPVVEKHADKIVVKIGEVPHPMEEKHHIEWIEFRKKDDFVIRKEVVGQELAEVTFDIPPQEGTVYAFCNIHGLWKTDLKAS